MRLSKLFCSSRIYKSLNFSNASMRALSGATGPSGQKSDIACAPEKKNDEKDAARDGGPKKGVVLGVYMTDKDLELTPAAEEINQRSGGKLSRYMNELSCELQLGKAFIATDVEPELGDVALTSFGPKNAGYNKLEELDEARENVRWGIGAGVSLLRHRGCATVAVDPATSPDAAAEAAELAAWSFQEFKSKRKLPLSVSMLGEKSESGEQGVQLWERGAIMADAQNWARYMSDMPANKMTPIDLAQEALDVLCPLGVQVLAHEREWAESLGMEAFLAVARGSCEPPVLLECIYDGGPGDQAPVLLAAKGVTFDSGGLCLKNPDHMRENRGSMAGAAVVLGAMKAIARLKA